MKLCWNPSIENNFLNRSEDVTRKIFVFASRRQRSPPLQIDMGTERIWSLILRIRRKQPAWYICDQSLPRKRKNSWSFTDANIQNYKVFAGSTGTYRSFQQRCSIENCVPRNFTKFTRKYMCQSLFFNKVAGLKPATLLKKVLAQVFSCEFCKISKNTFFTEHIWTTYSIRIDVKLKEIHYRRSPLVQGRLEIPCTLIIQIPGTVKSN